MAAEAWHLKGEYFESCNCEVSCRCVMNPVGRFRAIPNSPDGSCHVILAFHIDEGRYGTLDLGSLNAVAVFSTPPGQPMGSGGWSAAFYLDGRASLAQQEALKTIFTGQAGGPFGVLPALISQVLGVASASISYEAEGRQRRLRIEELSDVTVEMLPGHFGAAEPITIHNVNRWNDPSHPLAQAVARSSLYHDHGLEWDNSGRNSFFSQIDLKGP